MQMGKLEHYVTYLHPKKKKMKSKSCKILLKGKTQKYIFITRGNKFRRYALIKPYDTLHNEK